MSREPSRNCLALFLLATFAAASARAQDEQPRAHVTSLRCEQAVDPLGVDVAHPRLSWGIESERRGERQSAYQILVASTSEELQQDQADLWDSGKVDSNQTLFVPYAGKPLATSQRVFWKVRTWDRDGEVSPWSDAASWTMGVVDPNDWQARWIRAPWESTALLARREFTIKPGLKRATAHVCGLGHFEMRLNGRRCGENLLSPGWTKYNKTALYETHDVTPLLIEGANAVALALGSGMYHVEKNERYTKFVGSSGPLRAIVQIELEYDDGTRDRIVTDRAWRVSRGPVTFSNVYGGEDFDARLVEPGWDRPGFAGAGWDEAVEMEHVVGVLRGANASAPPLRAIETIRPVGVKQLSATRDVVDLGQNASYMPRIRVTGPRGSAIRLTHAEVTNPDGSINRASCGGKESLAWWQYTKGTDGEETWFPQFFYSGCRYLQVDRIPTTPDGALPRLEEVEGVVVHSIAEPIGEFSCSDELINRIHTLVRWAQRSNMVSVLTDCPHREKLGWVEQYHLNGPAIRYEFDVARIFAKGMRDMRDSQTDAGLIPNIAPEVTEFGGAFRAATEWGAAFFLVPWQQYQFTGDLGLCRENYPAMKRYMEYLATRAKDLITDEGLGDWYDLGPNPPGFAQQTQPPITATAFYYEDAATMAKIAEALGHADDAASYSKLAGSIRTAWLKKFRHAETATYATNSQCANALALVMGLAEPADRDQALAELIKDIRAHGNGVTTGDVGFRYLLLALGAAGRSDVIYDIVQQDERPGYAYQLQRGATSLTEPWDANHDASQNHFMLGQVVEWLYQDLAGIAPDPSGPGFERIIIRPSPVGDLTWAEATYRSARGRIASRWERTGGKFALRVSIPANTTATVHLPASSAADVAEGGVPASQADGVQFVRQEGDRALFVVESGSYEFTVDLPAPRVDSPANAASP